MVMKICGEPCWQGGPPCQLQAGHQGPEGQFTPHQQQACPVRHDPCGRPAFCFDCLFDRLDQQQERIGVLSARLDDLRRLVDQRKPGAGPLRRLHDRLGHAGSTIARRVLVARSLFRGLLDDLVRGPVEVHPIGAEAERVFRCEVCGACEDLVSVGAGCACKAHAGQVLKMRLGLGGYPLPR